MAFTRSGVRSPSPPLSDWGAGGSVRRTDAPRYAGVRGQVRFGPSRGNSSVGRAQPCQGWGRGFESRFPLWHSDAGWSSLVARRAHNPEVVGSNPTPATWNVERGTWNAEQVSHIPLFRVPTSAFRVVSGRLA